MQLLNLFKSKTRTTRMGRYVVHRARMLWRVAAKNYSRSQITGMAAALSFRTIFGLVPVMAVSLVVLHRFVPAEKVKSVVTNFLEYTGLTKIVVSEPPVQEAAATVPGLNIFGFGMPTTGVVSEVVKTTAAVEAAQSQRLEDWITTLLSRVDGINFGAIGMVSLVMLLYAALSMVVEIEKAFNQIAEAPTGKSWVKRITHYWTLLTLGPLLLVVGFAVAQGLQPLIKSNLEWALPLSGQLLWDFVGSLIAIPISMITLMILFTSVPNKRIDFRAALWGALGAAVLWEMSKWGLVAYVKYSTSYARLYGVIALLPLFLLWVYVTWIIVLLGFQVAVTLQTFRVVSRQGFQQSVLMALGLLAEDQVLGVGGIAGGPGGPRLMGVAGTQGHLGSIRVLDHGLPLRAMVVVAHRFSHGLATDLPTLSKELRNDEVLLKGLVERLINAGLLHQISTEGATSPSYALAKPAQVILASDVFAAGEEVLEGAGDRTTITTKLRDARLTAFRGVSVADLVAELVPPQPRESDPMMPGMALSA